MSSSSLRSFEYIERLQGTVLKRLYQQPSTTLAIFRCMLPHLAKTFVMAILFQPDPLPASNLDLWVRQDSKREQEQALELLERLHIFSATQDASRTRAYRIANPFGSSLRLALTGGGDHRSFGVPCDTPDTEHVGTAFLDDFARSRWESILYYIVGSAGTGAAVRMDISPTSRTLLQKGNFVEPRGAGRYATITKLGFTFLLQGVNAQVWSLLIVYLNNAEELQMDLVDVLAFLFTLGSLDVGQDYSTHTLSPTQLKMLDDLSDLGIVYRSSSESDRFYPTRLATTLTSEANALSTSLSSNDNMVASANSTTSGHRGFIVVETNYRVYAYTSSPLQISILSLFTKLSVRYPNMVAGRLSRESIQHAIKLGITSEQIISYLTSHAHPIMYTKSAISNNTPGQQQQPVLPSTVVDQIQLWQQEKDRMTTTLGWLLRDFRDRQEWDETVSFAEMIGVLVWRSDARRMLFCTRHEQIAAFLDNRRRRIETNGAA